MIQDNNEITHQLWLVPGHVNGQSDGDADSFAPRDVEAVDYHDAEEGPWDDHKEGNQDINYVNAEDISAGHVVLWYISHFEHQEPLPQFEPNAPCGDPNFPSVFQH